MAALGWAGVAGAEVKLAEAGGWAISTDGRINGFVSHVWGDDRPKGLESLAWVGFNESGSSGQTDASNKLRKTRVRSGYVPSTLAFNMRKQLSDNFKMSGRVEIGFQIANIDQTFVANPTWMDPRAVYLDLAGKWGSLRAGRDFGLFSRGNLFMNYELGHAYGVGFPCAYATVYGGSCGHVGFGTLWPDFHAQLTYSTPWFGDIFQLSAGVFDPRTVPTYGWERTPLPRFETEAVAKFSWKEGWGVKAWGNGAFQTVGTGWNVRDPNDPNVIIGRRDATQDAYGVGGGVQANLGPFKAGFAGYGGRGMDGYEFLSFNPIVMSQRSQNADGTVLQPQDRRLRTAKGFLVQASVTLGNTWFMGGFGRGILDRIPEDAPIETPNTPLLRTQTGISAGVFHRIENVVIGLDYFNAHYGFDPVNIGTLDARLFANIEQRVNIVNGGVTLEW
jgi:predicted porin